MYDRHLDTFIQVADCGSFLKASEKMFISANAITKQINLLEERLEVKLFRRGPQGLVLTDTGRLIYTEAEKMIRQSNAVLRKARELEGPREYVIHIGVSLMNPVNFLLEQWGWAVRQYPNIKLEIVPFEDTVPAFNEVLDHLGERIDVISCPYQTSYWGTATSPSTCGTCPARSCSSSWRWARSTKRNKHLRKPRHRRGFPLVPIFMAQYRRQPRDITRRDFS